ncbi:MAG: phosphoenolpyruvate--protein phosphotransferase, partial [Deltaproteobacteria bacterium]|nr:phosphoenolpyruvate--protein phosphotransferase [Deltaproteobacteria bacterium]
HIGLETVLLKGEGFTPLAAEGDFVKPGDPLIAFDAALIARKAASLLTIMVITSGEKVASYHPISGMAEAGVTEVLKLTLAGEAKLEKKEIIGEEVYSDPIAILNPAGIHARPAAMVASRAKGFSAEIRLIKGGRAANAKSVVALMGLEVKQHDKVVVQAEGPDARAAVDALAPLIFSGMGENLHALPKEKPARPILEPPRLFSNDPNILLGVTASPGLVTGKIFQLRHESFQLEEAGEGIDKENQILLAAIHAAQTELAGVQKNMRDRAETDKAAIFAAHLELLEDPELIEGARRLLRDGKSAAFAWQKSYTEQAQSLAGLNNELLAGRANDIRDVGRRVMLKLTGGAPQVQAIPKNSIIIARELSPSDTAALDKNTVVGFCTTGGSATSHASILARAMAIPAVAAIEERALELADGLEAVLDGDQGQLRLSPTEIEVSHIRNIQQQAAAQRASELAEAENEAKTPDGRRIKVVGNIGGVADAEEVPRLGGDGVGLLRSEFLFLQRPQAPSVEEQEAMYVAIAKALGPQRDLVVRTLDVGGDKPLAYLPMPPEINPFLGVRGIRLNLLGTDLFRDQVRAVIKAAGFSRLHIMFPMVTSITELREAKAVVQQEIKALGLADPVKIGIMVEVPAAALLAEELAKEADFFSIGTNDLTQYTLAIDRGHPRLAAMADALHPAVLRLIDQTVKGAHKHGRWVGVCGGLAGEIPAVPVLAGLGVDELSVSVSSIPAVKAAVRRRTLADCEAVAREVLVLSTAAEVRTRLASFAAEYAG